MERDFGRGREIWMGKPGRNMGSSEGSGNVLVFGSEKTE